MQKKWVHILEDNVLTFYPFPFFIIFAHPPFAAETFSTFSVAEGWWRVGFIAMNRVRFLGGKV